MAGARALALSMHSAYGEEGGSANGIVQGEVRRGEERGGEERGGDAEEDTKRLWVDSDFLRIISFQSTQNATEPCTKPKPKTKQPGRAGGRAVSNHDARAAVCEMGEAVQENG